MESEIIPRDADAQEDSVSSHSSQSHRAPDERGAKLEKNSSTLREKNWHEFHGAAQPHQ